MCMKKILIMLAFIVCCTTMNAAKNYDIVGVFHKESREMLPAKWRVVTNDDRIGAVKMVLKPAQVREKRYEVKATRVAENLYKIEGKTFHTELYIEVNDCNKKANDTDVIMVIENIRGDVKGRLIFD